MRADPIILLIKTFLEHPFLLCLVSCYSTFMAQLHDQLYVSPGLPVIFLSFFFNIHWVLWLAKLVLHLQSIISLRTYNVYMKQVRHSPRAHYIQLCCSDLLRAYWFSVYLIYQLLFDTCVTISYCSEFDISLPTSLCICYCY